ncbi:MAG TPA: hypothetical protein PLH15_00395 [Spirochaetota bacterium]|nr:hypothetical protein [Spirochaetota bacterium]HQO22077.1 hypothetical protein [Spirochaetota bacterium]HQQ22281.1 hypothetical protein [Spirochaetota bacterium]
MKKIFGFVFIFPALIIFASDIRTGGTLLFNAEGSSFFNIDKKKDVHGQTEYRISDLSYKESASSGLSDMVISFNNDKFHLDDTRRYRVKNAVFNHVKGKGSLGGGSAFFSKKDDRVDIVSSKGLWLANSDDLGSFSIEFRINPASLKDAVIFSRVGLNTGIKNGIEIRLEKGRITAYFYKVFSDSQGRKIDTALTKGPNIQAGKWHHYFLSFDRLTGKLSHLIGENEYDYRFMTEKGVPSSDVMIPSFADGDAPIARIGKGFSGLLDEFRINYLSYEDARAQTDLASKNYRDVKLIGRTPVNREGIISSKVYQFEYTGTMIKNFKWDGIFPPKTFLRCEIRMSDKYFDSEDSEPKWYKIDNNQRNIYLTRTDDGYLRGKYFQWRARLIATPEGEESPVFKSAEIDYELDSPPSPPLFLEVVETGDKYVIIRWKKNVDHDIAGYNIYYGIKNGESEGILRYAAGKRVANFSNSNYVTVKIDNNLIEENRGRYVRGMLEYPEMKNNVLYYFSVSAYDSYKVDTQYNHEGRKSAEVYARPSQESEITR